MTDAPNVQNILNVYNRADAETLRDGLAWYLDAHNTARTMGAKDARYLPRNAGIIAALSPLNGWNNNKRKAMQVIANRGRIVIGPDGSNGIGLSKNVEKAVAIYNGADPRIVLRGLKVRAFFETILDPTGDVIPVIDRHAFDIAVGEKTNDVRRGILSRKGVYHEFANAYRTAAKSAGIGSAQMQAVTWVQWRREFDIDQ